MNTVTTAQVRRITRSTWTTAGFSATAMNTARPTQIRTVRTLASSDTAIVNTNTENSTFAITRSGMSSTTWRGTSPTAILQEARPMVEDIVALPSSARELVLTLLSVPRAGGGQTPRRCGREDSNLHGLKPPAPKAGASTNSATPARVWERLFDPPAISIKTRHHCADEEVGKLDREAAHRNAHTRFGAVTRSAVE